MRKILSYFGILLMIAGLLSFLVLTFIVKSDGSQTFDLFDLVIPQPPLWVSYIPYLGGFVEYIFQLFSFHGLVTTVISFSVLGFGSILYSKFETKSS